MKIDWLSQDSHLLLNPRLLEEEALRWHSVNLNDYAGHLWLTTSGSTQKKLVGLHKHAFLVSAQAVNKHLGANSADIWLNPLPDFHVGGLGIQARAFLSNSPIQSYGEKWSPIEFLKMIHETKATLTALVPTQIYDLIIRNLQAPKSLRAVVIGGGALNEQLYKKARHLGWPLLPSYGLTECASQVATASLASLEKDIYPPLNILSHIEIKISESNQIIIKSPSLITAYGVFKNQKFRLFCPLEEGWLTTQDLGALSNKGELILKGRQGDFIKIGGESVKIGFLENVLEEIKLENALSFDLALAALPDDRLGHAIHLFSTSENIEFIRQQYDQRVMPFERIRKVHIVPRIPRSPLNKILKSELLNL